MQARIHDALERWPLVVVHGLAGMGSSRAVAEALPPGTPRVALRGATRPEAIRQRFREALRLGHRLADGLRSRSGLIWLDDAHAPEALTKVLEPLLVHSVRWVIAARGPVLAEHGAQLAVEPLDPSEARALLEGELARLGARTTNDAKDELARAAGGWPLAIHMLAVEARARGGAAAAANVTEGILPDALRAALEGARATLSPAARRWHGALALLEPEVVAERASGAALNALLACGLAVSTEAGPHPIAPVLALALASEAEGEFAGAIAMDHAERAHAARASDPERTRRELQRVEPALVSLLDREPIETSIRATLFLAPLWVGSVGRSGVVERLRRARAAAEEVGSGLLPELTLELARAWMSRGEHESAAHLLEGAAELMDTATHRARRLAWLAHIAAWRGDLDQATAALDEAASEPARSAEVTAEILVQRATVALRREDADRAGALARQAAALADHAPLPRAAEVARSVLAEVALVAGDALGAAALFARARATLDAQGDQAGALYLSSRLAHALRAAGETERAERVAEDAKRTAEHAREVALAFAAAEAAGAHPELPGALGWRLQIEPVRARALTWVAAAASSPVLVLQSGSRTATLGDRSLSLARRSGLWAILTALADAHGAGDELDSEALFRAGWPGQQLPKRSLKKRVQTAVWTLRKGLLGDALRHDGGRYSLTTRLTISRG